MEKSNFTKSNTNHYFYDDLFNQFDNLINITKNELSNNNNFKSIITEKNRLTICKRNLNSASNILLSIDNIKDKIPKERKHDIILKLSNKYNDFEKLKKLIENYHKKLEYYFSEANDYKNYTLETPIEEPNNKKRYLKLFSKEGEKENDNDLTEHFLMEDIRKNLEQSAKNLDDVNLELKMQHNKLLEIDNELGYGHECIKRSNKTIRQISQKRFIIKLILHLLVIFMAVAIIVGLVLKWKSFYRSDNNNKDLNNNSTEYIIDNNNVKYLKNN